MQQNVQANIDRVASDIETLATYNSFPENPGVSRQLFTDAELEARSYVKERMRAIGMSVHEDAIGNWNPCG